MEVKAVKQIPLADAAHRLHQDWHTTWGQVLRGEIPAERRGRRWYVDAQAVEEKLRERETQNLTPKSAA